MSSTSRRFERLARRFYSDHIARLAETRRRGGRSVFPLSPDPGEATYFVAPERSRADRSAMERNVTGSTKQFLAALEEHWTAKDDEDLNEVIPALEALASAARALAEEADENEEVSPFVYAMF